MSEQTSPRKVFHKLPAAYKKIPDIDMERDIRVRLLGKVVEKTDDGIMLSDGFSNARILISKEIADGLNLDDQIRVFARVLITETGPEFRAEIIQDMHVADMELYQKVFFSQV